MIDFKAGQKVWWNDPEGYSSGEYEVLEDCKTSISVTKENNQI